MAARWCLAMPPLCEAHSTPYRLKPPQPHVAKLKMELHHIQGYDSCIDLKTASILPQCRVWKQQLDRQFPTPFGSWRPLYGLFACISFVLYLRSIFQPRALFKARWYAGTAWFHGKPHGALLRPPATQLLIGRKICFALQAESVGVSAELLPGIAVMLS